MAGANALSANKLAEANKTFFIFNLIPVPVSDFAFRRKDIGRLVQLMSCLHQ
jgi:hypothetical protein